MRGPPDLLWPIPGRVLEAAIPFDEIPAAAPFLAGSSIQVVRQQDGFDDPHRGGYAIWVPLTSPVSVLVSVVAPEGGRVSATGSA